MRGFCLFFVVVLFFSAGVHAADHQPCDSILTNSDLQVEITNDLLIEVENAEHGIDRIALKLMRSRLEKDILKVCRENDFCTHEQISEAVHARATELLRSIDKHRQRYFLTKAYTLMIGAMITSAALSSYLKVHLPHHMEFFSDILTPLTTVGILKFGAPFWEKLNAITTSAGFRLRSGRTLAHRSPEMEKLDDLYADIQGNLTSTQQVARNTLIGTVAAIRGVAKDSVELWLSGKKLRAADRIAEYAIVMRRYLVGIPHDNRAVLRSIRMVFTNHIGGIEERKEAAALIMDAIIANDPEINRVGLKKDYEKMINAWMMIDAI